MIRGPGDKGESKKAMMVDGEQVEQSQTGSKHPKRVTRSKKITENRGESFDRFSSLVISGQK
jgi:hypothetical protein